MFPPPILLFSLPAWSNVGQINIDTRRTAVITGSFVFFEVGLGPVLKGPSLILGSEVVSRSQAGRTLYFLIITGLWSQDSVNTAATDS